MNNNPKSRGLPKEQKSAFEEELEARAHASGEDAVLQLGRRKTQAALRMEQLKAGIVSVPQIEIDNKKVKIIELHEGGVFSIDGIRFFELIEKEIHSGRSRISLKIPGDAASIWECVGDKTPGIKNIDKAMQNMARSIELQLDEDQVARVRVTLTRDDHGVTDKSQIPPPDYLFTIEVLERINLN